MPRRAALLLLLAAPSPARADFLDDVRRTFQSDIPHFFQDDIPCTFGGKPTSRTKQECKQATPPKPAPDRKPPARTP